MNSLAVIQRGVIKPSSQKTSAWPVMLVLLAGSGLFFLAAWGASQFPAWWSFPLFFLSFMWGGAATAIGITALATR